MCLVRPCDIPGKAHIQAFLDLIFPISAPLKGTDSAQPWAFSLPSAIGWLQLNREGFPALLPDHLLWLQSPNKDHSVLRNASPWIGS